MRIEREAPVQQILGKGQGFGRWQDEVIRNAWNAFSALRKWSTESVAGTIASGAARFVAITLSHVFIMSSMEIQLPRLRDRPIAKLLSDQQPGKCVGMARRHLFKEDVQRT